MKRYDPDGGPNAAEWLRLDESERTLLVEVYHERKEVELPNSPLHALIHVIVENQLAEGESVVVEALDRLRSEGLDRHDAIHAIGMVLAEHLWGLLDARETEADAHRRYFERLKTYTAAEWIASGQAEERGR